MPECLIQPPEVLENALTVSSSSLVIVLTKVAKIIGKAFTSHQCTVLTRLIPRDISFTHSANREWEVGKQSRYDYIEINTGEAGISEWIEALNDRFQHWKVYIYDKLTEPEYAEGKVNELLKHYFNYYCPLKFSRQ